MSNNTLTAPNYSIAKAATCQTLVVFDDRVSDIDILVQALLPDAIGVTIDSQSDGSIAITQLLATTGARYLAIVAHGEPGAIQLGKNPLNIQQLQSQSHLLRSWGVKEIALYSCEVAQGDVGKDFIYQLSELTGATVAATATKAGSTALGGSWSLDVTTSEVRSPVIFEASILQTYQSVLAVSFKDGTTIPAGTDVNTINLEDLNGDGKLDIITVNRGSNDISVLLGNGAGGFGSAINYAVGTDPLSAAVGDFNSDGKLDLFTANRGSSTISVLFGNGVGGFGPANTFAAGAGASNARAGDFNGDGKLDLSTTNYGSNTLSILFGDGLGGFSPATNYTVGATPYSTVMGDFNGDGKLDFITAGTGTNSLLLSVLLNNGNGSFTAAANVAVDSNPDRLRSGDFNGDGKLDLAITDDSSRISVLLGNGTGGFGTATKFTTASGSAQNLLVGDLNGDGKLDLLSGTFGFITGPKTSFFAGDGTGSFSPAVNVGSVAYGTGLGLASNIIAGDFNGDGKLDVASADGSDNTISVLLNNTVAVRNDFNSDGKADILWRNDDGRVALWEMNGSTVTTGTVFATVSTDWKISNSGDFNGDNKADILWRNDDGRVALWTMNGATQTSGSVFATVSTDWKISGTGDFDGDGKSDILWRNNDGRMAIWQMDGATQGASAVVATVDTAWQIAGIGDFGGRRGDTPDADGKSDILWRNANGDVALWLMNGLTPISQTVIANVSTDWQIKGTADFNGDGEADILWRNTTSGQVAIWTMNGATPISQDFINPYPVVDNSWKISGTSDVNGDGNADILWRNDNGGTYIWEMSGATVLAANPINPYPVVDNSWTIAAPIL